MHAHGRSTGPRTSDQEKRATATQPTESETPSATSNPVCYKRVREADLSHFRRAPVDAAQFAYDPSAHNLGVTAITYHRTTNSAVTPHIEIYDDE